MSDRGRVLLAVRVQANGWTVMMWIMLVVCVGVAAGQWTLRRRIDFTLAPAAVAAVTYLLHPRIKFYESGVEIPPQGDQKLHYLRWDQIERYSWDGDRLIPTGTTSMLAGGPVEGGSTRIPPAQHLAVNQVLWTKLPAISGQSSLGLVPGQTRP